MQGPILFEYVETVVWRIHYAAGQNKYKIQSTTLYLWVYQQGHRNMSKLYDLSPIFAVIGYQLGNM
jgi:hypothetical protein